MGHEQVLQNQTGYGSCYNEGLLHILQGSRTGTSPSDRLVPYIGNSLVSLCRGWYPSAEMQATYSTAPTDWAISNLSRR